MLQIWTIRHLELVASNSSLNESNCSLLHFLDHCKTKLGSRLLRMNILQPLTDYKTLSLRYDTIEFLLSKEPLFFDLSNILKQFCDMDHLCAVFGTR